MIDEQNVSLVSVTPHFITTHSKGRRSLNILLSFAQFERDIIGEQIRGKIAGQRRREKWAGGVPVLGYDVDRTRPSPKLVINRDEAVHVRRVFAMYLDMQAMLPVVKERQNRDHAPSARHQVADANDEPRTRIKRGNWLTTIKRKVAVKLNARSRRTTKPVGDDEPEAKPQRKVKIPRVSRLIALAIQFDEVIRTGKARDAIELAILYDITQPACHRSERWPYSPRHRRSHPQPALRNQPGPERAPSSTSAATMTSCST